MEKIKAKLKTPSGQFIELGDSPFKIGGFEGICDYVVYGLDVSPIHAIIENRDGKWCIQDMNSAAGVKRNGIKIAKNQPVNLDQQDRIEISGTELTIIMELDLLKSTDLQLINQIYKNWLMAPNAEMQDYHKSELMRLLNEKIAPLEVSIGTEGVPQKKAAAQTQEINSFTPNNTKDTKINKPIYNEPVKPAYQPSKPVFEEEDYGDDEGTEVLYGANHSPSPEPYGEETNPGAIKDNQDYEGVTTVLAEDDLYDSVTMVLTEEDQYGDVSNDAVNRNDYVPPYPSPSDPYTGNGETMPLGGYDDDATSVMVESNICILERVSHNREKIIVDSDPFIIGKAQNQVNFCLDERGISRRQAKIFKQPPGDFCISDLDSKNGTYINGRRLKKDETVVMRNGDMISFAEYNFIISIGQNYE